jgi:hypothetical protein
VVPFWNDGLSVFAGATFFLGGVDDVASIEDGVIECDVGDPGDGC